MRFCVLSLALPVLLAAGLASGQTVPQDLNPLNVVPRSRPALPEPERLQELTPEKRGDIFMARKMYREAIEMYRQAPQSSAVVHNKLGIAFHQLTDLRQAKKQYERAAKLNPKYAEALNNIGTVYYAQRSYRRAVSWYNKALKAAPYSASVYSNLGTAQFARRKYKQASEAYQKALELDPDVFEHRGGYGTLLQERTIEEKAKFHYYLAKAYARAGAYERALQYLRIAFEEGYRDKKKAADEPEFAEIRELPEFQHLLTIETRVL